MAVLQNMWLRGAKKKLGGTVLYTQGGRTLQRELAPEVKNPKTPAQMGQRVKWANLVAFYRANAGWMPKAFENKKATQSDYNKFMSLNASRSRIYLTKEQARQGACVVDSYQVSDGSLQPVDVFPTGNNWVTNLYLTGLGELDDTTTIADFSKALLSSNAGLRSGDQLSFIRVTQLFNNNTGIPYIQVRAYELIINEQSTGKVADFWPDELISVGEEQGTPALVIANNGKQGGFAIIVSRTQAGRVLVSPSQITQVNMTAVINQYSSNAALAAAIESYGQGDEVFLDSKDANAIVQKPTTLSITGISGGTEGAPIIATGGDVELKAPAFADKGKIYFNQEVTGTPELVKVIVGESVIVNDSAPSWETGSEPHYVLSNKGWIAPSSTQSGAKIRVEVTISGVVYSAEFVYESGTIS